MQGERDAALGYGEVYAESLKGLVDQLKDDLDFKRINFVIGRLSDYDMANEKRTDWVMIRDAQVKVASEDPYGLGG